MSGGQFLVGINLGWFEDKYGSDLGVSEFSDSPLWGNLSAPITIDLSKPNPPQSQPYLSQNPATIDQYFARIDGVNLVRLWLFEQLEGIVFSKDGNNNPVGLDQTFIDNLLKILDSANNHNIKVYLALFNSWDTKPESSNIPQSRLSDYQKLFQARKQIIVNIMQNPSDFCNNVLVPLLNALKGNAAVYAIDLVNEPEGMTENNIISMQQLRSFVDFVAAKIKLAGIKVSVGCMRKDTAVSLSSTDIDFADFHIYNDKTSPATIKLEPYVSSDFSGKYCIIGECGYHPETNPYDQNQEIPTLQAFLGDASKSGYACALAWRFQDYKNPDGIVQTVKNLANTNPMISSAKKKGCFIATAAMNSQIHPHVQFLREFRDSVLLKSSHKKQFENILEFYYRFSPPVADAMNNDRNLKLVIKYMIVYPIVFSLGILVRLLGNQLKE
jgi:hypothetical protein